MIKRVFLENWKSHGNSEFEFGKGTNVIVGKIGSGKSAIMDGICFCLFGSFPALTNRRVSLEEVIMAKPNQMQQAKLRMDFSYNQKSYTVERIVKRKGTSEAMLYCNNKLLAGPKASDVNAEIEKELEINYELFSRAVYSEQNQIDFFLRLNPGQRKEKFDELLELEKYEGVRSNAVSTANRMKALSEDKKNWLSEIKKQVNEKELLELEKKALEKEKASKQLAENKKILEESEKKAEKWINELEKKEKEFKELREERIRILSRIEENNKEIEKARMETMGRNEEEIKREMQTMKEETGKAKKEFQEKEKKIDESGKKIHNVEKKIMLNESKKKELEKHLLEIKTLKSHCPICRQELKTKTKEELMERNIIEQKQLEEEKKEMEKELTTAEKELEKEKNVKQEFEEGIEKNREKLFALEKKLSEIQRLGEKKQAIKNLGMEEEKIRKRIIELAFEENDLLEKRKILTTQQAQIKSIEKEILGNREFLEEIRKRIASIQEMKKQLAILEKDVSAIDSGLGELTIFVNALKATQAELRETLIQTINEAMQDIWPKLYPYQDLLSAKMVIENGSYELEVKQRNNDWVNVEGVLSGGERSAAALCIRIAFSLVLTQNLSWIILDEPTHNLDTATVSELSKMLKFYLPELVEQIFIITHDRELEKSASAALFVLNREKNEDGITQPEQLSIMD